MFAIAHTIGILPMESVIHGASAPDRAIWNPWRGHAAGLDIVQVYEL